MITTYEILVADIADVTQFVVFEVWECGGKCVHDIIEFPKSWSERRKRANAKRILVCVDDFNDVWKKRKYQIDDTC